MSGGSHSLSTAVAVLALSIPIYAHAPGDADRSVANEQAGVRIVPGRVSLEVVDGSSPQEKRLAVLKDGRNLGSIAVPSRVSVAALVEGLNGLLRHPNGNDLAVGFKGDKGCFVVVFLLQPGGAYLAVDVSQVESVNIGVIGPNRTYRDVHTVPTEWLSYKVDDSVRSLVGDDPVQLWLQTRAWDVSGRRYLPREPLIITRDGRPLWR